MGKGLRTKSGRLLQMLLLADPNVFDPNGARTVAQNVDNYTYEPGNTYDSIKRGGANAKAFNALTESIRTGEMSGALYYNLSDAQLFPYVLSVPGDLDTTAGGVRKRTYRFPQYDRAERPAFAVEEGTQDKCVRGLNGHFNNFKFTSKRGENGNARFSAGFTTKNAPEVGAMTGATPANAKIRLTAAAVTAALTMALAVGNAAAENIAALNAWDAANTIKSTIEAHTGINTVTVDKANLVQTAKVFELEVDEAEGIYTIAGSGNLLLTQNLATWQTALRLRPGFEDAVLAGTITAPTPGPTTDLAAGILPTGDFADLANMTDGNNATKAGSSGNNTATIDLGSVMSIDQIKLYIAQVGAAPYNAEVLVSATGAFAGEEVTWGTATPVFGTPGYITLNHAAVNARYVRVQFPGANNSQPDIYSVEVYNTAAVATPGEIDITVTIPVTAANPNVAAPAATGTGAPATLPIATPYAANGYIDVTVTNPANTKVTATKLAGNGWTVAAVVAGSSGFRSTLVPPKPVLPQHIAFYVADTYAGLDEPEAYVGTVEECELDIAAIREPRMAHDQEISYSETVDAEEPNISLMVLLWADQDAPAKCTELVENGEEYVSKPQYWRLVLTCPDEPYKITIELYGSIGRTVEQVFGGNVEERRFFFDLLENLDEDWNFQIITEVPV